MPYAVKTEIVKELAAMPRSSADKPGTPVYVSLKSNVAPEGVEIGRLFMSEEEVLIFPYQYAAVFLLSL